jgi:hypothetical protein
LRLRVEVEVERVADSKGTIRRTWLLEDPVLESLRILKLASETNYLLTNAEAERLEALWARTGEDWNEAESTAGLWLYARMRDRELSRLPDSPVADMARLLGRAVTGVYNKVVNFRSLDPDDARKGFSNVSETDERVWARFYRPGVGLDLPELDRAFLDAWGVEKPPQARRVSSESTSEGQPARGQGREIDPKIRLAVETRAMRMAFGHYRAQGFDVEDTHAGFPFDLRCRRGDGLEVRVEVKGTRGDGESVVVTRGEVESAAGTDYRSDLFVLAAITVVKEDGIVTASGGRAMVIEGWAPADDDLTALTFRCRTPREQARLVPLVD